MVTIRVQVVVLNNPCVYIEWLNLYGLHLYMGAQLRT